jgi:hypothetical protein
MTERVVQSWCRLGQGRFAFNYPRHTAVLFISGSVAVIDAIDEIAVTKGLHITESSLISINLVLISGWHVNSLALVRVIRD